MPIIFQKIAYAHNTDPPLSYATLKGIDLEIPEGKIAATIEETGSDKFILVRHLNAPPLPSEGEAQILDKTITAGSKPKSLRELRRLVGPMFRFPECQPFKETVEKDISFGPENFSVSAEETVQCAKEVLKAVGLDESYLQCSPSDLFGRQKRRIAIAGVLIMNSDVLVLDEPTAGLDPQDASDTIQLFVDMSKRYERTVLIVTYNMEHVLQYCEEVVVIQDGGIKEYCNVQSFFEIIEFLQELNINPPVMTQLREELVRRDFSIGRTLLDMDRLAAAVACEVKEHE